MCMHEKKRKENQAIMKSENLLKLIHALGEGRETGKNLKKTF